MNDRTHPTNPDGSPAHIPGLFELEQDLVVLRRDRERYLENPTLDRTIARLEKERAALISRATLLVGAQSFESLFGPAAISLDDIERIAEAALGLLTTETPPFERPDPATDPEGFASFAARCEMHAEATMEYVQVVDERKVLALAWLARGVLLGERDLDEIPRAGRRAMYIMLPDGTLVRIRSMLESFSDVAETLAQLRDERPVSETHMKRVDREHRALVLDLVERHQKKLGELEAELEKTKSALAEASWSLEARRNRD